MLTGGGRLPEEVCRRLERSFWPIDFRGRPHGFDCTDYYAAEFGPGLFRHVVSFRALMDPAALCRYKRIMYNIEMEYAGSGGRRHNLDVGYLDPDKLVLASFKRGRNKLYMGEGVYADMLMEYVKGRFLPMPWAFSDFKDGRYDRDLLAIREKLKASLRRRA